MRWPLKWLRPVETALNVYQAMSSVTTAMGRLKGDALEQWNKENAKTVAAALAIQRLRDDLENGEND